MSRRLSDRLAPMIEESIERHALGDDITWEIAFQPHPQAGCVAALFLVLPSPIVGQNITISGMFSPIGIDADTIDVNVRQLLDAARAQRSSILNQSVPQTNGHGTLGPTNHLT